MFALKSQKNSTTLACSVSSAGYSFSLLQDNHRLLLNQNRLFDLGQEGGRSLFKEDVEKFKLLGKPCRIILEPDHYQLFLMDALDVPPAEMAKAIKWRLKGLVSYPLNDVALDTFLVPPHGVAGKRKKVFVAVTLLSGLNNLLNLFRSAYLEVSEVSIADMALCNHMRRLQQDSEAPLLVIHANRGLYHLYLLYQGDLYIERELPLGEHVAFQNTELGPTLLLEIQRSIDYCLTELKLPELSRIVFTPTFPHIESLVHFLQDELKKEVFQYDLNRYLLAEPPLSKEDQARFFYSIGGALTW